LCRKVAWLHQQCNAHGKDGVRTSSHEAEDTARTGGVQAGSPEVG
jgi:hypothetical protein